jgi:hypothetical protein
MASTALKKVLEKSKNEVDSFATAEEWSKAIEMM